MVLKKLQWIQRVSNWLLTNINTNMPIGKTNALGYELYSVVAEMNGQGIPVAFAFVTTDGTAKEHAKTRLIEDVLDYIITKCPNIKFSLSDKDPSEIRACVKKLIEAKHQLCLWHGVRYVERRLKEKRATRPYDPRIAHKAFDFIDPTWAPGINVSDMSKQVQGEGLRLRININGTVVTTQSPRPAEDDTLKVYCYSMMVSDTEQTLSDENMPPTNVDNHHSRCARTYLASPT